MQKFTTRTGIAAHLPMINVDTDMIIPKQYLKTIKRTGLSKGLFAELRYDEEGKPLPDFVLHKPPYDKATILITGENFGCGSSREHAPWALLDFGILCIIAPSFADLFYNNCFKNGILPITLPQAEIDKLIDDASRGANAVLTIDLPAQEIRGPDGGAIHFDIDPFRKRCLMEGLDEIGLTLEKAEAIRAFEQAAPAAPAPPAPGRDAHSGPAIWACQEEAQHFAGSIGAVRIGVGTVRAAAGPGMAAFVEEPLLPDRHPALVANDRAGVWLPCGRAGLRAFDALTDLGPAGYSGCVRRMDDLIRIAVEDHGK